MSDMNNGGWPFAEDTSDEGLDYSAIFGGGAAASDTNPFEIPAAQVEKTAVLPEQKQTEETTVPPGQTQTELPAEQPSQADTEPKEEVSEPISASEDQEKTSPAEPQEVKTDDPPAEAPNPIEAAFVKQEKNAVQAAAKSLFEKMPVFSYGSAKEDITDPAQTFEELRIAKSDDFPELSEGKRVSWTVEYGKVTKAITDPKGATIRSVKEEIERSKAFLDGLKKAKDKNPDCLVKPRVTAQSKGIAAYKGVFQTMEEARASKKPICLIPGGDGRVYELRKTELGEFIAPKDNVVEFSQIRAGFIPALPLIPMALLQQIISFFRCYMGEIQEFEALAHILWDKTEKEFTVHIPKQEVSKARVDADLTLSSLPEGRYLHYADIHSHNSMAAKFSPVDDQDEQATRIYIVLGRLNKFFPEISVRMSCGGTYQELDPGTVIEGLGAFYPREWRDNVHISTRSAKPLLSSGLPAGRRSGGSFWGDAL